MNLFHLFAAAAINGGCGTTTTTLDTSCLPKPTGDPLATALNIVFALTASISVLMIVIAGFRFIVAHGDPNSMAQARNTILYAVIGLLVTLTAFSIVTFVLKGVV